LSIAESLYTLTKSNIVMQLIKQIRHRRVDRKEERVEICVAFLTYCKRPISRRYTMSPFDRAHM